MNLSIYGDQRLREKIHSAPCVMDKRMGEPKSAYGICAKTGFSHTQKHSILLQTVLYGIYSGSRAT